MPLSKLKKVSLKKPSKHGSKRNSIASSSQGFRSPPGSNTISPALSRIQTRNNKDARSPSSRPGHLGENATATPRSSSPAPPLVTETQPFDFGELINRKEDPMIVRIISEDQQKVAKVDLRFMSVLYQDEARALADRLRGSVRR